MSYTFLQEQGEESSAASFSDIPACVLSKLSPTGAECYCNGNETESCQDSQSGTTFPLSTESRGEDLLMPCVADSHARTSAPLAVAKVSAESEVGSGENLPVSWVKFDPLTSSWRTRQFSLLGDLESFSATWPRWGMMRAGECYPLPMPSGLMELRAWITSESASGLRLPTLHGFSKDGTTNGPSGNELGRAVNRMPSIRKTDADKGGRGDLIQAVRGNSNKHFKRMPTVVSVSQKGGRCGLDGGAHARLKMTDQEIKELTGGSLNPPWVEWLMGWPIGWTDLQPLAMDSFRKWLGSHGKPSISTTI